MDKGDENRRRRVDSDHHLLKKRMKGRETRGGKERKKRGVGKEYRIRKVEKNSSKA